MIFYKPLPTTSAGRKFEIRGKCIGIYDKGKPGTVVESQNDLVDAESGEVYARMTGSGFYVSKSTGKRVTLPHPQLAELRYGQILACTCCFCVAGVETSQNMLTFLPFAAGWPRRMGRT